MSKKHELYKREQPDTKNFQAGEYVLIKGFSETTQEPVVWVGLVARKYEGDDLYGVHWVYHPSHLPDTLQLPELPLGKKPIFEPWELIISEHGSIVERSKMMSRVEIVECPGTVGRKKTGTWWWDWVLSYKRTYNRARKNYSNVPVLVSSGRYFKSRADVDPWDLLVKEQNLACKKRNPTPKATSEELSATEEMTKERKKKRKRKQKQSQIQDEEVTRNETFAKNEQYAREEQKIILKRKEYPKEEKKNEEMNTIRGIQARAGAFVKELTQGLARHSTLQVLAGRKRPLELIEDCLFEDKLKRSRPCVTQAEDKKNELYDTDSHIKTPCRENTGAETKGYYASFQQYRSRDGFSLRSLSPSTIPSTPDSCKTGISL